MQRVLRVHTAAGDDWASQVHATTSLSSCLQDAAWGIEPMAGAQLSALRILVVQTAPPDQTRAVNLVLSLWLPPLLLAALLLLLPPWLLLAGATLAASARGTSIATS